MTAWARLIAALMPSRSCIASSLMPALLPNVLAVDSVVAISCSSFDEVDSVESFMSASRCIGCVHGTGIYIEAHQSVRVEKDEHSLIDRCEAANEFGI